MSQTVDLVRTEAGHDSQPFPTASVGRFVTFALSAASMVSAVDRQLLTLLFIPIKESLLLTDTEVSLLAGFAFVFFYITFGLGVGWLADRTNRKRIITIGIAVWSVATAGCGLAQSFAQLFAVRVFVGVGEATLGPCALSILSDTFPRDKLTRALSFYTSASFLGAGLSLVAGGLAIEIASVITSSGGPLEGFKPYQATFILVGIAGSLAILPVLAIREPARHGHLEVNKDSEATSYRAFLRFANKNRRTLGCHTLAWAISSIAGLGAVTWMPTFFIRVHHWTAQDIGYVYGLMLAILGGAGVLAGGACADYMTRRGYKDAHFRMPMISVAIAAIPGILVPLVPTSGEALVLLAISTFLGSFPVTSIVAVLQLITPNAMRGKLVSLFNLIGYIIGMGLGPTAIALITDFGFHSEMSVGYSMAIATAVISPCVIGLLWFGLRAYRMSIEDAENGWPSQKVAD